MDRNKLEFWQSLMITVGVVLVGLAIVLSFAVNIYTDTQNNLKLNQACIEQGYAGYDDYEISGCVR